MNKVKSTSVFGEYIERYIELRQSFGLRLINQASMLRAFDRYVCNIEYTGPLTQELAAGFATSNPDNSADTCARRYSAVRYFSNFLLALVPETPILDPKAIYAHRTYTLAYIYNEEELVKLLELAQCISARNPLRGTALHAMVSMAIGTGMRISEVVNLDRDDVDLASGIVRIRCTKFFKERLVPVHSSLLHVLREYAGVRDAANRQFQSQAFFVHLWGGRFSKHTLQLSFSELTRRAGMCGNSGVRPTFHSIRHTFAVRKLIAWYRDGRDVQAMLPVLATYMGHTHYTYTAHYITAVPELMELAAQRFHGAVSSSRELPQ